MYGQQLDILLNINAVLTSSRDRVSNCDCWLDYNNILLLQIDKQS